MEELMSSPTYRYGIAIFGANYAQPDHATPEHFWMAQSLSDVRRILGNAADNCPWRYDEDGAGKRLLDTPVYGDPGDGAYIYRVDRSHPDFAEVLDLDGDRARHAFAWLDLDELVGMAEFGPRGGITIVRN
jgi:hypothetical protein